MKTKQKTYSAQETALYELVMRSAMSATRVRSWIYSRDSFCRNRPAIWPDRARPELTGDRQDELRPLREVGAQFAKFGARQFGMPASPGLSVC